MVSRRMSTMTRGLVFLALVSVLSFLVCPAPVAAAPRSVYFPVTGHSLSDQFLTFWRTHGALSIFGYPISQPIDVAGRQVQYFERARFELHPEFQGTPYEVELELLGTESTASRTEEDPFKPVSAPPGWQDNSDRDYFAPTGHFLAYGFKSYWETHGGLAVFGYPISEELTENGRTVQYFERARFEWWPEHRGTEYEIQLGLLGDWAASRDQIDTSATPRPDGAPDYSDQLFTQLQSIHIPVLMYHKIAPNAERYVTPLSTFEQEMDWVKSQGYNTVTLQQLYNYVFNGGTLPPKPIMITFDDSTAGQWDAAAALDARGMKGVFFVITGNSQLSPDQLRSLAARGDEIESHTVSHPDLTKVSDAELSFQLTQSKATLEGILGQPVHFVAYPYGQNDARVQAAVAAAGYSAGIAAWGGQDWTLDKRWYEPRVEISGVLSLSDFASLVR